MRVLIIDGRPAAGCLLGTLLDGYAALPPGTETTRIAVCDLPFDPVLHRGYDAYQPGSRTWSAWPLPWTSATTSSSPARFGGAPSRHR